MKQKKILFLSLALLFPISIFIFLKIFGENQFDVPILFSDDLPYISRECGLDYSMPYHLPDSAMEDLALGNDSLIYVYFGNKDDHAALNRVIERYKDDPVTLKAYDEEKKMRLRTCIFFLQEPFDVALVDRRGAIRGQYNSRERDEVDRLITEIAILIKKY